MVRAPVVTVLFVALLSGCASGLGRPVVSIDAVPDAAGVQRVDLDLHSYYFKPNRIVVKTGRPVELTIRNRSIFIPHNFTIADEALNVEADKWGIGSRHVRFTAPAPGEYRFFCHVDAHGKKGMAGTLVVVR